MTQMAYQDFTQLEVWKRARILTLEVTNLVDKFPSVEKYRLADQLIRSVRSIKSNIAEGHGRFTYNDQLRFCIIARGSLGETLNHLIDAYDCNYIAKDKLDQLTNDIAEIARLLNGYIGYLRSNNKQHASFKH